MAIRTEHSSLRHGLVGAWCPSLGASGLSLIDRSGLSNHATLTNMSGQDNWQASGSGIALNFDGTNDFATGTSSPALTAAVWFSLWFRLTAALTPATKSYSLLLANRESSGRFRQSLSVGFNIFGTGPSAATGRLNVLTFDGQGSPSLSAAYTTQDFSSSNGTWYHASGGWNGSAWKIFVNGVDDTNAQNAQRAQTITPASPSFFGAEGTSSRNTPCLLDDIRIYNRALTPAEIRLLASCRGIGLQPLPDRAAGLPRRFSVNVGGTWRAADSYVRTPTDWRLSDPKINVGGVWK